MKADGVVVFNHFGKIGTNLARVVAHEINKQVLVTQRDVQTNIVKYDLIDTGKMLGSVSGHMTGTFEGEVTVSAESEAGYPYPTAQNYGTRYIPASPFFSEAVTKAEQEFPRRFDHLF